jgi:hypothetical protein
MALKCEQYTPLWKRFCMESKKVLHGTKKVLPGTKKGFFKGFSQSHI